mmetsp:Transcript_80268/g.214499  ORF Transcript_80268/g.214499 Transcript_80268/m.214499 type:complete len:362 (+) Transcript_80268:85-1170(+)
MACLAVEQISRPLVHDTPGVDSRALSTSSGVAPTKTLQCIFVFISGEDRHALATSCRSYNEHLWKHKLISLFQERILECSLELEAQLERRLRDSEFDLQRCISTQEVTNSWIELFEGMVVKIKQVMMRQPFGCAGGLPGRLRLFRFWRSPIPETWPEKLALCQSILQRARNVQVMSMQFGNALQQEEHTRKQFYSDIQDAVDTALTEANDAWMDLRFHNLDRKLEQCVRDLQIMLRKFSSGAYNSAYPRLQQELITSQQSLAGVLRFAQMLMPASMLDHEDKCEECPICLCETSGASDGVLSCCRRYAHAECLARWAVSNGATCPLCRSPQLLHSIEANLCSKPGELNTEVEEAPRSAVLA